MRAAHIVKRGDPKEALEIVEIPKPEPDHDEVRIRVEACALNHLDVFARVGHEGREEEVYPKQTGVDIAGCVDAVGEGVTDWEPGDGVVVFPIENCGDCEYCLAGEQTMCNDYRIIGHGGPDDTPGGLAEYITISAENLEPKAESLSFEMAAAWPVTYTTAWRMVVNAGELRPSETALVLGASGGVGNATLRIANRLGAKTYATTSTAEKAERLESIVEAVIDYTAEPFDERIMELTDGRGVDLVADHVGQATWQQSIDSLAKGGRMVVCGATSGSDPDINIRSLYQSHRRIIGAPMGNRKDFRAVYALVAAGELEPEIQEVFALDDIAEAHRRIEQREVFGKVIVRPNQ